ncbi:methyltransferase [Amycolatopsis sp. NPDC059021]|uniref:methyltransferase n=1 Tax=Amycolatopsis sp. NPDC059021 TaxID=3346704 RepID=UPI00366C9038
MSGSREYPPSVELTRLMDGAVIAQLICLAADLGVADLLAEGTRSLVELAERTGSSPDALQRMLRTLASAGVFAEPEPGIFALTPLAEPLRTDSADSVRDLARIRGSREHWRTIGELRHSVRTGRAAFDQVHGTDWWTYLDTHPGQSGLFIRAMGDQARQVHLAAADAYDFSTAKRLVDVGGGRGDLVALLLGRYPGLTAVVYDRPRAVAEAEAVLTGAGVRDRAEPVAGDFFESVPPDGDVYLLSRILHDWNDEQAVAVLRAVARAISPGGKVVLVELVVPEGDAFHPARTMDLIMLAMHGGKERSVSGFAALFAAAGLAYVETRPTGSPMSLVIAEAR